MFKRIFNEGTDVRSQSPRLGEVDVPARSSIFPSKFFASSMVYATFVDPAKTSSPSFLTSVRDEEMYYPLGSNNLNRFIQRGQLLRAAESLWPVENTAWRKSFSCGCNRDFSVYNFARRVVVHVDDEEMRKWWWKMIIKPFTYDLIERIVKIKWIQNSMLVCLSIREF